MVLVDTPHYLHTQASFFLYALRHPLSAGIAHLAFFFSFSFPIFFCQIPSSANKVKQFAERQKKLAWIDWKWSPNTKGLGLLINYPTLLSLLPVLGCWSFNPALLCFQRFSGHCQNLFSPKNTIFRKKIQGLALLQPPLSPSANPPYNSSLKRIFSKWVLDVTSFPVSKQALYTRLSLKPPLISSHL